MNDHHDCGPDLTMSPWSIGKYAKRSSTIHIGSQDLTTANAATGKPFPSTAAPSLINVFDIDGITAYQGVESPLADDQNVWATGDTGSGVSLFYIGVGFNTSEFTPGATLDTAKLQQIEPDDNFLQISRPAIRNDVNNGDAYVPIMGIGDILRITELTDAAITTNSNQHRIRVYGPAPLNGIGNNFAGATSAGEATQSITGSVSWSRYVIDPPDASGVNSLVGETTVTLVAEPGASWETAWTGIGVKVDWDEESVNDHTQAVNVEKGDIIHIASYDENQFTERVVVAVNQSTNVVTLDHPIVASDNTDGRSYDTVREEGSIVRFRRNAQMTVKYKGFDSAGESHCNFDCFIPNIIGFPEHKRCLVQVQSFSVFASNTFSEQGAYTLDDGIGIGIADVQELPAVVGIEIGGVGVMKVFSTSKGQRDNPNTKGKLSQSDYVAIAPLQANLTGETTDTTKHRRLSYGWTNEKPITTDGVLISSPFGKSIKLRYVNLTSDRPLDTREDAGGVVGYGGGDEPLLDSISNNPTHLVLKLLFLDDDEVPMR